MKKYNFVAGFLIFVVMPLLFWASGNFPRRNILKETISIFTLLAFFMMLGQFYLTRGNGMIKFHKMGTVVKVHKVIGYVFISILLVHPFLIVVPRYFESGIAPTEAFVTILTMYSSPGIVLGMIAWCLLLILGLTSFFRNTLGLSYKAWRTVHGLLSIIFISVATWHAIDLGRHTDLAMSTYMIILAVIGVLFLLKVYFIKNANPIEVK